MNMNIPNYVTTAPKLTEPSFLRSNMVLIIIVMIIIIGLCIYFSVSDIDLINILSIEKEEEEDVSEKPKPKPKPKPKKASNVTEEQAHVVPEDNSPPHQSNEGDVLESFVAKHSKNSPCKPRFVESGDVGNYILSAEVESKRGNSCLKNCSTENDQIFVNNSGVLPEGQPLSSIDTTLEYSDFNTICKEPDQVCKENAQVISKYSPGGLLMVEQNENLNTTNSGINLLSSVIQTNNNSDGKTTSNDNNSIDTIEHFATGAAELILIVFMAAWCPHCKNAKPAINKFKKLHDNKPMDNVNISVIEYDADKHKDKVKQYKVDGFPSYKILIKSKEGTEKIVDHGGGRTYEDLLQLCKKHT
jgi:thiol-disulfide isomerase/thioredoxin